MLEINKKKLFFSFVKSTNMFVIVILIPFFILNSCDNPSEPEILIDISKDYKGQICSNYSVAIIKPDNSLWTWGNIFIQENNIPTKVAGIAVPFAMDLENGIHIIADKSGNIFYRGAWIAGYSAVLNQPININKLDGVQVVDCLVDKIILLKNDGTVWTFTINLRKPSECIIPVRIIGGTNIIKLSKTLALKLDGSLFELLHTQPEYGGIVPEVSDVIDLQNVWNRRTFILKKDGTVWGWGDNFLGVLGDGTTNTQTIPVQVKGLSNIVKISSNYDYNLALKNDGTVWFWGYTGVNSNNVKTSVSIPQQIGDLNNIEIICASSTCYFMKKDGSYWYYNVFTKKTGEILF